MIARLRIALTALGLALVWLALPGAAQEDASAQPEPNGAQTEEIAVEAGDEPAVDVDPEDVDPLADLTEQAVSEADEGEIDGATMERFRPTEKISEDRSVAFPNDI